MLSPLCSVNNSYFIVNLLVPRTTWWWLIYKAETCSCILRSVAYYIVILSDKLLCFWLHVYVNTHIIIYIVLSKSRILVYMVYMPSYVALYTLCLQSLLTLNIPGLDRQRCLPSWGPRRTPWFFFVISQLFDAVIYSN